MSSDRRLADQEACCPMECISWLGTLSVSFSNRTHNSPVRIIKSHLSSLTSNLERV